MRTYPSNIPRRSGVALVITLALLVIIVVLVLAIATSSISERRATNAASNSLNTELLANLVENLTQTQIRAATTQPADVAWASQPGMIRTFNTNGTLRTAYKLYSGANQQILSQASLDQEFTNHATQTAAFATQPATFTDLNAPTIFKANVHYPIADPRALGKVDGFLYNNGTTAPTQNFVINGTSTPIPVIPMPVQWMYVLRDGQIVAPDPTAEINKVLPIAGALADNPIVGRIAYWTDDESSKLNINTAADGTYWDTPRTSRYSPEENFSKFQPARNEFQRYQGHPGTTSLRPIFSNYVTASSQAQLREKLLDLNPRYIPGGSLGGTVTPTSKLDLTTKQTRNFYASTDEFLFDTTRAPREFLDATSAEFTDAIEQTRFFLSAHSRAPEVNLFNLPRISLWPIRSINDSNNRTVNDQLNLFCSTLGTTGTNIYAFTRSSAEATDGEFTGANSRNLVLYDYLNTLMKKPFPGFGATDTFASKYDDDQQQILTEIYDYIRSINIADKSMLNTAFKNFTAINDKDVGLGQVAPTEHTVEGVATKGFGRFATLSEAAITIIGQQFPDPSDASRTRYNARAAFLAELTSLAHGPSRHWINLRVTVNGLDNLKVSPRNDGNFVDMGFPASATYWPYQTPSNALFGGSLGLITGMNTFWNQGSYPNTPAYPFVSDAAGFTFTTDDIKYNFVNLLPPNVPVPAPGPADVWYSWPAFGGPTIVTGSWSAQAPAPKFAIRQTGPITVTIGVGTTSAANQTIALDFPQFTGSYPTPLGPTASGNNVNPYHNRKVGDADYANANIVFRDAFDASITLDGRLGLPNKSHTQYFFPAMNDVTKSLVPIGPLSAGGSPVNGDLRLVAATSNVPDTTFLPNIPTAYNSDVIPGGLSHSLAGPGFFYGNNASGGNGNGRVGRLVRDKIFLYGNNPNIHSFADIPSVDSTGAVMNGANNSLGKPGDFDTGVSFYQDGPWINKPDEGDELNLFNAGALSGNPPYYKTDQAVAIGDSFFSPNRQVASPVQLGSLPTGVKASNPWQTLLFSPNPAAVTTAGEMFSATAHRGFAAPRDHLLLDLLWMPVVEPYAISDPFSTAGKINLNHQLAPFGTAIRRDTALRGVLLNTKITAFPLAQSDRFKTGEYPGPYTGSANYRYAMDVDRTITEINRRFSAPGGMYVSPSEICDVFLIPQKAADNPVLTTNLSQANIISDFWNANSVTGDNLRERPYNSLYPRLTTKSNVFTVHYTVQTLKKVPGTPHEVWDESRDKVAGEQRGSITLERYIDPRDPEFNLPEYDFAAQIGGAQPPTLGRFYKFRTVSTRQFRQ